MPHKISAKFVCPSPKVSNFWKKKLSLGVRSPCINLYLWAFTKCFIYEPSRLGGYTTRINIFFLPPIGLKYQAGTIRNLIGLWWKKLSQTFFPSIVQNTFLVACATTMPKPFHYHLKSLHFKKTVARISFLSKLWYFLICIESTTILKEIVFLKWTDFNYRIQCNLQ